MLQVVDGGLHVFSDFCASCSWMCSGDRAVSCGRQSICIIEAMGRSLWAVLAMLLAREESMVAMDDAVSIGICRRTSCSKWRWPSNSCFTVVIISCAASSSSPAKARRGFRRGWIGRLAMSSELPPDVFSKTSGLFPKTSGLF